MEGKELSTNTASSNAQNEENASSQPDDSGSTNEEMSAWEKRLEGLE